MHWRHLGLLALICVALPTTARAASEQVVAVRDVGADVTVDDAGRAFLVSPSARDGAQSGSSVRVRSAAPGAAFGAPRTLMRSSRTDRAVDAGLADDGSGVIVVQRTRRSHRRVLAAGFDARGRVGRMAMLSRGAHADFAASAVAPSGAAVVVWFRHRGPRWRLEASVREAGSTAFGSPEALSAYAWRACCTRVSVAIGARGHAVATWRSTARPAVWAALRSPGRAFRAARRLTSDASNAPEAVAGSDGTAAVTYSAQHVPLRSSDGLQLHRAVGDGAFGPPERLNPGGGVTLGEAAVSPAGTVIVAWVNRSDARVRVSEAGPAAPPVVTGVLGAHVTPDGLAVAAGDDGRALVAWSERVSGTPAYAVRAMAATRDAPDAEFGAPAALGPAWRAVEPRLARLVPGGGALVLWRGASYGAPPVRHEALTVTRLP